MYTPFSPDVAAPGLLLFAALPALLLALALIVFLEAFVLWLVRWARFGRSLLASLAANLLSAVVGAVLTLLFLLRIDSWIMIGVAFLLSILIEAPVLMLFRRGAARACWIAALEMNLLSYGLVIAPLYALVLR